MEMRTVAILFNLLLIGTVIFLLAKDGVPKGNEVLLLIPLIFAPIFSLIAILGANESWLSLYFKRKALEEKQKIDQLTGNKD
jgi:hypothetical protein